MTASKRKSKKKAKGKAAPPRSGRVSCKSRKHKGANVDYSTRQFASCPMCAWIDTAKREHETVVKLKTTLKSERQKIVGLRRSMNAAGRAARPGLD